MTEKKISAKNRMLLGIIIVLTVVIVFAVYQYSIVKNWSNRIYPGVKIEQEDLTGKTKDEARKVLQKKYTDQIAKSTITINTDNRNYILNYSNIDLKYSIDEAVNTAFNYGKNFNTLKKYKLIEIPDKQQYNLKFTYDSRKLNDLLDSIQKDVNKDPVDAKLNGYGGNFQVIPEQGGKKLERDKLQNDILSRLDKNIGSNVNIKVPLKVVNARITSDKISCINTKISMFSTDYGDISSEERANNIILATKSINGKIILPGDSFSFNDIVGERTAERGYESAPVIIGNQVDSGLGGGICQVSTTLYNAVLRADIKATERAHHTMPSHYVPLGMDATVDYGNIDYKFKNTLKYPIYIEGDSSGGVITFAIYSSSAIGNIVTSIASNVYQTIEAKVDYQDDPTLPEGQTEVVQPPSTGYKVKVTKTTTQDGKVISQELIADDYYEPINGVIKRGTQKQESQTSSENPTSSSSSEDSAKTSSGSGDSTNPAKSTN